MHDSGAPDVQAGADPVSAATLALVSGFAAAHAGTFFAPDAVFHDVTLPDVVQGREAIEAMFGAIYRVAFPDARADVRRITVAGSRAVLEFVFRGTHTGPLLGRAPTGRRLEIPMAAAYRVEQGAIHEGWLYYDGASFAAQLGWGP